MCFDWFRSLDISINIVTAVIRNPFWVVLCSTDMLLHCEILDSLLVWLCCCGVTLYCYGLMLHCYGLILCCLFIGELVH